MCNATEELQETLSHLKADYSLSSSLTVRRFTDRRVKSVLQVAEYAERNGWQTMSLAKAAEIAHLEKTHFSRIFRSITGVSFSQWKQVNRLLNAVSRMRKGSTVESVVIGCRYGSRRTFERAVKRWLRMTPNSLVSSIDMQSSPSCSRTCSEKIDRLSVLPLLLLFFPLSEAASMEQPPSTSRQPQSSQINFYNIFLASPVSLSELRNIAFNKPIYHVTAFAELQKEGFSPAKFPVRLGIIEGPMDRQSRRAICELRLAGIDEPQDPFNLPVVELRAWIKEADFSSIASALSVARFSVIQSAGFEEFLSAARSHAEDSRFMSNATASSQVEPSCRDLLPPEEIRRSPPSFP